MTELLYDNISDLELDTLFVDRQLVLCIREKLGVKKSYDTAQVMSTAFIDILSNNRFIESNCIGDTFLKDAIAYVYNYDSISVDCLDDISHKVTTLSQLLKYLLSCNSLPRYVNLVAWHYKYSLTSYSILKCVEQSGNVDSLVDNVAIINNNVVREFGCSYPQVLIHILCQLSGQHLERYRFTGQILASDITVGNVIIAREDSIITRDLEEVLYTFGMEDIPIKQISKEAAYLMREKNLRPLQMRILRALSYRDKITVIKHRIIELSNMPAIKPYTDTINSLGEFERQHAFNVALLSGLIAVNLRIRPMDFDRLLVGALLHDIGKSEVPKEALQAERRLTKEELELIKRHPSYGERILKDLSTVVKSISAMHHENEDGTGYPKGKTNIPLAPAIVHIVDVYDAMCRQRDYKKPYDRSYVRRYIESSQFIFNPEIKREFLSAVKLFLPGEALFISGIPCVMYDYHKDKYSFYIESLNQCLYLTEEEVEQQLAWQNSMLN